MILYFTGTGNSRYIAKKLEQHTGDLLISINEKIRNQDFQISGKMDRLIFVVPTYGWRIPRVVEEWIRKMECAGGEKQDPDGAGDQTEMEDSVKRRRAEKIRTWFVMDCGSEIGNAAKYNRQLCEEKSFSYMGTVQIVMPENYIAMFPVPDEEESEKILRRAEPLIEKAAEQLQAGKAFPAPRCNVYDRFMSFAVNPVFYRFFVKADAFRAEETCIGCGKCAALCPMNNIVLKNGQPVWGKTCTHCMACISYCPAQAIEYGKKSIGKRRYHCD